MGRLTVGQKAPDFTYDTPYEQGLTLYQSLAEKNNILIFSRYIGCRVCQLEMVRLAEDYARFKEKGAALFLVLQSGPETTQERVRELGIEYTVILDPSGALYPLYGVDAAQTPEQLLSDAVKEQAAEATEKYGFVHGAYEGNEMQLPATFILGGDGLIKFARYGSHASDYPTNDELLSLLA